MMETQRSYIKRDEQTEDEKEDETIKQNKRTNNNSKPEMQIIKEYYHIV